MAKNITAMVLGGTNKVLNDVETVQDVLNEMGLEGTYAVSINGEPAELSSELNDYEFVSFAPAVKGGIR